jgi:signal transduction histidine kinase
MLNLSRPYKLQRQPTKLHALIAEAAEALEISAARQGVQMELSCRADYQVDVDAGLMLQALLNICQNAIQAMPNGGQLKIECLSDSHAERPNKNVPPMVVIKISDTGPGLPLEHLGNIFDPFFTTKDVAQGTGLGLAVSSRIVQEHGGQLEAANNALGGAVFSLHLPEATFVEVNV